MAIASAKAQAGRTATVAARIAHQVHGAIGFTREHSLRLSTTRLWSWREESGNDLYWWSTVGEEVLHAPEALWPLISGRAGTI
jgi:acyl-CoA dehydrogenase